jgi:hypothetical protein
LLILASLVLPLSACAGILNQPPAEFEEPNPMRPGPGLLTGDDGKLSVEL